MTVAELDVFSGDVEMRVAVMVISGSVVIWLVPELAPATTSLVSAAHKQRGQDKQAGEHAGNNFFHWTDLSILSREKIFTERFWLRDQSESE